MKLAQNTFINLLGSVLPLVVTLVTIPPYLHLIGDIRFGVLAIVGLLLGYFGLFDMGLGRATSKYIAEVHDASAAERSSLFWTVLFVNAGFGVIGGLVLWTTGRFLLGGMFKIPEVLRPEVLDALPWIASAVPVATVVSVLIGALDGRERFLSVNALQVGGDCVFQVVPLAVAYIHGPDLQWLIASSVMSRALVSVPMFFACRKHVPLESFPRIETRWIRKLFAYGSWVTISGIINPILVSLDRMVIGAIRGPAAVTHYTIPFNFSTRFLILPVSISRTLFPRFSMEDDHTARELAREAVLAMAVIMTPAIALALVLVKPFFHWWLGADLAGLSGPAGEILLLGVWINGLAHVPSAYLQARGRPDLTAKFHLIELAPFVALLWIGLRIGGVEAAAFVWTMRVAVDFVLLSGAARLQWRVAAILVPPALTLAACAVALRLFPELVVVRLVLMAVSLTVSMIWAFVAAPPALRTLVMRGRSLLVSTAKIPLQV